MGRLWTRNCRGDSCARVGSNQTRLNTQLAKELGLGDFMRLFTWILAGFAVILSHVFSATLAQAQNVPLSAGCQAVNAGALSSGTVFMTVTNTLTNTFTQGETLVFKTTFARGGMPGAAGFTGTDNTAAVTFANIGPVDTMISYTVPVSGARTFTAQLRPIIDFSASVTVTCTSITQQTTLTTPTINQSSNDMLRAVVGNLDAQFDGPEPVISTNGFAISSRNFNRLMNARKQMADGRLEKSVAAPSATFGSRLGLAETVADQGPSTPWNFWVKGTFTHYDNRDTDFKGNNYSFIGGLDYRYRHDTIIGLFVGRGITDYATMNNGMEGSFEALGRTVGTYVGHMVTPSLKVDAVIAYTDTEYDNAMGAVSGSFSADRYTFAANIKGHQEWYGYRVEPTLGLMWATEDQSSFFDTAGNFHSSQTVEAGRLSLGSKIFLPQLAHARGLVQYWFGAHAEYDFSNQDDAANSAIPDIDDVTSARLQVGLKWTLDNGTRLDLQGDLSGLGSGDYLGYGGTVRMSVPLH